MRLLRVPPILSSVVTLFLITSSPVSAGPFSKINELVQQAAEKLSTDDYSLQNATLDRRTTCAAGSTVCGYYQLLCCLDASQTCGQNSASQAVCLDAAGTTAVVAATTGTGVWQYSTSVWVTTGLQTMTSVYSTWVPATVTAVSSGQCVPNYSNNESPCGPICCASGQYCADSSAGTCKPAGNGGFTTTGVGNSPPVLVTTSNGVVMTKTVSATTTLHYQTPIPTGTSAGSTGGIVSASHHSGLSGGAIAGIVIGVLVGIVILALICLCCCFRAAWDTLAALFGIGKKRDRRTHVEEEYVETHRRYGSGAGGAGGGTNGRWYGAGAGSAGGRSSRRNDTRKEKKSGIGGLGAIGLGLGGLAIALGLKRKHDKKHEEKSDVASSYDSYYYSGGSSKLPH